MSARQKKVEQLAEVIYRALYATSYDGGNNLRYHAEQLAQVLVDMIDPIE
jgi:hypothetical protein